MPQLKVTYNEEVISYSILCSKVRSDGASCLPDVFLMSRSNYLSSSYPVQYPIWHFSIYNKKSTLFFPNRAFSSKNCAFSSSQSVFTGSIFGAVRTVNANSGILRSARLVRMIFSFPPPYRITSFEEIWDRYLNSIGDAPNVRVTYWSSSQYEKDMKMTAGRTRRLLPLLALSLVVFCCLSSMKCRCSFPCIALLSFCGVLSAGEVGIRMKFFIAAIGIDDMFIMLSIWEETVHAASLRSQDSCELIRITFRLADCRDSIVSILLTTFGNVLVFTLGSFSPFPIIRTFCVYSAVSLLVLFIFQLTLFGALLAIVARYSGLNLARSAPVQQSCSLTYTEARSSGEYLLQ
ncbi:unnamed protein product [Gongylonema pulchrum]|uniref:SSD domain-containing protein n=1 Tax=Gongylonema pulchrum TaxID=637853 RepID=A0A183CY70_9BILA|nr:unnamed protein product [Gongylonema pulchrum]